MFTIVLYYWLYIIQLLSSPFFYFLIRFGLLSIIYYGIAVSLGSGPPDETHQLSFCGGGGTCFLLLAWPLSVVVDACSSLSLSLRAAVFPKS